MFEALMDALRGTVDRGETYVFLIPIYVALLAGERVAHALLRDEPWDHRDSAANIAITGMFLLVDAVFGKLLPVALVAVLYEYGRIVNMGEGVGGWLVAFLAYDLAWYVDHRIGHRTGFFWAMHQVHHSSNEYNMTVASRGFVVDKTLLFHPAFYLLPLLGMSPYQFVVIVIITNIWGIAQHTRLVGRLGPLDAVLATPSNHRVHHGSDDRYLDKNYGEVLVIWDRLFGTYQREDEEPTYGVTDRLETRNPVRIEVAGLQWLLRKLQRAHGWREKLACLVLPPGWEPAGVAGPSAAARPLAAEARGDGRSEQAAGA